MVRFEVVGDDLAQTEAFSAEFRAVLAAMPEITVLAPTNDASGTPPRLAVSGQMGRAVRATTHGWRVGTVASGDHRTDIVVRPPRPRADNDPLQGSRTDHATASLSLNVAVELNEHVSTVDQLSGAPRPESRHTIAFVLAATGRSLIPRTQVRERLERLSVPSGCEVVWP